MKSLARLHVWWPSLDTNIESFVKSCINCTESAKEPIKVPLHQWDFPAKPWERHMVVCQLPRNTRNQEIHVGTPVCYLRNRSSSRFQPSTYFYQIYIF